MNELQKHHFNNINEVILLASRQGYYGENRTEVTVTTSNPVRAYRTVGMPDTDHKDHLDALSKLPEATPKCLPSSELESQKSLTSFKPCDHRKKRALKL